MYHLLYISTARSPINENTLSSILTASRRNNAAANITGLLVAGGRRFLQALEGSQPAVEECYARIRSDSRHFAAVILANQAIDQRRFGNWAMGYQQGGAVYEPSGMQQDIQKLVGQIADPSLQAYFAGFLETHANTEAY